MKNYHLVSHLDNIHATFPAASHKPVIGITANYENIDATLRDRYYKQVVEAGGVPVIIPPVADKEVIINTLNSIDFSASDTAEARKEALRAAVQNAQEKAAVLAEASGLTLSGIASLSENGTYSYANTRGFDGAQMGKSMDAATVVQSARLCVSATVTVSYSAQ